MNSKPDIARTAAWITTGFMVYAIIASVTMAPNVREAIPLILYYLMLLIHTYFSLRTFLTIGPRDPNVERAMNLLFAGMLCILTFTLITGKTAHTAAWIASSVLVLSLYLGACAFRRKEHRAAHLQQLFEAILGGLYLLLPILFTKPNYFAAAASLLFIVATLKYLLLIRISHYKEILRRKMIVDMCGASAALLALVGFLTIGYQPTATLWTISFIAGSIYLFFGRPLYDLPKS